MKSSSVIIFIIGATLFTGCVSQAKYNSALQAMESYRSDSTAWATQVTTLRNSIQALEDKNAACKHQADSLLRIRQGNGGTHALLFNGDLQDTDLDQLTSQLRKFAKESKIISGVKKNNHQIQLEINSGASGDAGKLSATETGDIYKIVSMIKTFKDLEVFVVNAWGDQNMSTRANIGDSAWVGSAGRGTLNQTNNKETGKKDSRDSAATASIGSQPYPGSGAVAMNTKKKENLMEVRGDEQSRTGVIMNEFSRHGLSIHDLTRESNKEGKVKSINRNKPVKLIIQQRTSTGG